MLENKYFKYSLNELLIILIIFVYSVLIMSIFIFVGCALAPKVVHLEKSLVNANGETVGLGADIAGAFAVKYLLPGLSAVQFKIDASADILGKLHLEVQVSVEQQG